jgi:hypothetical protein
MGFSRHKALRVSIEHGLYMYKVCLCSTWNDLSTQCDLACLTSKGVYKVLICLVSSIFMPLTLHTYALIVMIFCGLNITGENRPMTGAKSAMTGGNSSLGEMETKLVSSLLFVDCND